MIDAKTIRIASRLYDARDNAKALLKRDFDAKMKGLQEVIREFMAERSCDALPATMAIVTQLQKEAPHTSKLEQTFILAAYVEMAETKKEAA